MLIDIVISADVAEYERAAAASIICHSHSIHSYVIHYTRILCRRRLPGGRATDGRTFRGRSPGDPALPGSATGDPGQSMRPQHGWCRLHMLARSSRTFPMHAAVHTAFSESIVRTDAVRDSRSVVQYENNRASEPGPYESSVRRNNGTCAWANRGVRQKIAWMSRFTRIDAFSGAFLSNSNRKL